MDREQPGDVHGKWHSGSHEQGTLGMLKDTGEELLRPQCRDHVEAAQTAGNGVSSHQAAEDLQRVR